jgi:hypothetical protein
LFGQCPAFVRFSDVVVVHVVSPVLSIHLRPTRLRMSAVIV